MQPAFQTLAEFFAMGGHGRFVWIGWGFSFLTMLALILLSRNSRKAFFKHMIEQEGRKRRQQNRPSSQIASSNPDQHTDSDPNPQSTHSDKVKP